MSQHPKSTPFPSAATLAFYSTACVAADEEAAVEVLVAACKSLALVE